MGAALGSGQLKLLPASLPFPASSAMGSALTRLRGWTQTASSYAQSTLSLPVIGLPGCQSSVQALTANL